MDNRALLGDDIYMIKGNQILDLDDLDSLTALYQPLLSSRAIALYLNLLKRPLLSNGFDKHTDLCVKMNCRIDDLYKARLELEHVLLLKTYVEKNGNVNLYYYEVAKPKSLNSFLKNDILGRMLANKMGIPYVEKLSASLNQEIGKQLVDITDSFVPDLSKWNEFKESEYAVVKDNLPKSDSKYDSYDYKSYLERVDENQYMFPWAKISGEDFRMINTLGTQYKVEYTDMQICLNKAFNHEEVSVDYNILFNYVHKYGKAQVAATKDGDPVEYAYSLSKDNYLTQDELNDVLAIKEMYSGKVSNEIINTAIKTCIENTTEGHIKRNYVDKVIQSIINPKKQSSRSNSTTSRGNKYRRMETVPEYTQSEEDLHVVTEDMIRANLERLKKQKAGKE